MEKSMEYINTFIEKTEQLQYMLNLQKSINKKTINKSIDIIKSGRILIKQGTVIYFPKQDGVSEKRHIILFDDIWVLCKPNTSQNVYCILPLAECNVTYSCSKTVFHITYLNKIFSMFTPDTEWVNAIEDVIDKVIYIILIYCNKQH
jgi:hypothetical protein